MITFLVLWFVVSVIVAPLVGRMVAARDRQVPRD